MTTLTCSGYSATPVAGGMIRLEIAGANRDALQDKMYMDQIATAIGKSVKQVDKLSRRKVRPLPLVRGNGRPYGFRSVINEWLQGGNLSAGKGKFPFMLGGILNRCRCGKEQGVGIAYCPDCQP